ncbi:MAG: AsmA family protein [Planctomycetes bacterium]|nr:AsmA family protein [Planctomycetota bacterium]
MLLNGGKKMKIKKVVTTVIAAIVVLPVIIILAVALFGGNMIKAGVEIGASNALGVSVTLDEASLSLFAGKLELEDLQVSNPPEFEHEKLLTMGLVHVNVALTSLTSDTVVIQDMIFDEVTLVIEQKGLKTNLQTILDSLPEAEPEEEPAEPVKDEEKPAKKLKIANLEIKNVHVKVNLLPIPGRLDEVTFNLSPIVMTDLGSDDKMTIAKLTSKILMAIAKGVATDGTKFLSEDILGPMQDVTGAAVKIGAETLKKVTDIGAEGIGKGAEGIKKGVEGIGDGLKGIFGGKKKE